MAVREQFDEEKIYCRKLGHYLTFRYCRSEEAGLPCSRICRCWAGRIPVSDYLNRNYSPEEIADILAPPVPKIVSLINIIEKTRKSRRNQSGPAGPDVIG